MSVGFGLGVVVATPGALSDFGPKLIAECPERHASGDWGDLGAHDQRANDQALVFGTRIFSAYDTPQGRVWVITEADRSSICILCSEHY